MDCRLIGMTINITNEPIFDSLKVNDFDANIVPFPTVFMNDTKTLWFDPMLLAQDYQDNWSEADFTDAFSYCISESELFHSKSFSRHKDRILFAERYGGLGISDNGGGVRCGNWGAFQIKGIGKNPLVGSEEKKWHSYGSLNAPDAIYETILARLINRVLPIGAAPVYGVIITGTDTAYYGYSEENPESIELGYGALLIRKSILRPAHFLRAGFFKISSKFGYLQADIFRTRSVNKKLYSYLEKANYTRCIGYFLSRCANQFACARAVRMMHGNITPSNLCLDGRWIDLTNAGFIPGGVNIGGFPPFYEEPDCIERILYEMVYTYTKFNGFEINITSLTDYYRSQFRARFRQHSLYVFGLETYVGGLSPVKESISNVASVLEAIILSDVKIINEWPSNFDECDPILLVINCFFMCSIDSDKAQKMLADRFYGKFNIPLSIVSFEAIINQIFHEYPKYSRRSILIASYILAVKRTYLASIFYKGYLLPELKLALSDGILSARLAIDTYIFLIDWIFEKFNSEIIIYADNKYKIYFDVENEGYYRFVFNELHEKKSSFTELFVGDIEEHEHLGFNFQGYFATLMNGLQLCE